MLHITKNVLQHQQFVESLAEPDPFISDDVWCYSQPRFDEVAKLLPNVSYVLHKESDLPYVVVFLRLLGYQANYLLNNSFISVTSQGHRRTGNFLPGGGGKPFAQKILASCPNFAETYSRKKKTALVYEGGPIL